MTGISVQPEQHVALDLDAFIEAHYARLLGLLTLKTGSREEAEDLAQEAMLKLVRSWPEVSQMEHPWGWLATVAVNSSTSSWRRVFRGRAVAARLARADHHLDETGTVEMLAVIRDLPHRQRTALLLRHYARLSVRDTAIAMNCAEGTVKALVHQAIARLRSELQEEIDDADR